MKRFSVTLSVFAIVWMVIATPDPIRACEAGVCDGTVTVDGRPICWKLRVQVDIANDVHYFAAGIEYVEDLGPALHSYLGVGPADDGPEGPVRFGVNSKGLAIGFNAFNEGDWLELHHYALGHAATATPVDTYLQNMTNLGTIHYYSDASGAATLWENDRDPSAHWEYNTQAPARAAVWRDFDGDEDEISYAGWVGRANTIDMNPDGMDTLRYGEDDRTAAAQTVPGRLIDCDTMDVKTLATAYFRHDVLARDNTVSSSIVHGVLPDEDVRLTTMWTALGHSEAAIFVPLWLHGVETGGETALPAFLDFSDSVCAYVPAKGLINDGADEAAIQQRTLPVESRFFDTVVDEVLPVWRARDWADGAVAAKVGREMKRVQDQMDADAYSLLHCLYTAGVENFAPLESGIDGWSADGLVVHLAATATDSDGTISATHWNYGDGQLGASDTHEYAEPGTYLVSFTVTDDDGVSSTDWEFVTVVDPTTAVVESSGPKDPLATISCDPNPFNPRTVISFELRHAALVRLEVFDLRGHRVRSLLGGSQMDAGRHEVTWNGRDSHGRPLSTGVYVCRLNAGTRIQMHRVVLLK